MRLRARRGAVEIPVGTAVLIGVLVGVSLVVGAFGGFRLAVATERRGTALPSTAISGTVVPDSTGDMSANCATKPTQPKMTCYRDFLDKQIASGGVATALASLRSLTRSDPDVDRDAHMYAHGIGIDAFHRHPDIDATFTHCTAEFSSGCYHGVLQAYFDMRGTADPKVVAEACQPYEGAADKRWLLFQCLHGMGHGLNMALDHDLPRALTACDLLGERWHRESCYGGAFMENITHVTMPDHPASMLAAHDHGSMGGMTMPGTPHTADASHPSIRFQAVDSANPQYPCSIVGDQYGRECYRIQTALMLYLNGGNLSKTAHSCDQAPKVYRPECYESLGRDISAYASYHPDGAVRMCAVGAAAFRRYCYAGAAETFVDEQARPDPGFAICSAVPNAEDKPTCFHRVGELVLSLAATDDARARMCALPASADTRACR
jgi:hypothetical protein